MRITPSARTRKHGTRRRQIGPVGRRKALITVSLSNIHAYLPVESLKMPLRASQSYDAVLTV
jgi:hypothetical protein